jgi:uncharacterized protein (TIGR03067 family)
LAQAPNSSIPFLKQHVKPAAPVDPGRLDQLLVDLSSESFQCRQRATQELEKSGPVARTALEKLRDSQPALEVSRRVERLLALMDVVGGEMLRDLRAIDALEQMGTVEVLPILEALAKGAPGAPQTRHARSALERCNSAADDAIKDRKRMQGTWKVLSSEYPGKKETNKDETWIIAGDRIAFQRSGQAQDSCTFKLDPGQEPAAFDGTGRRGIYCFDGPRLVLCWTAGKEERPKEFAAKEQQALWVLQKKEP